MSRFRLITTMIVAGAALASAQALPPPPAPGRFWINPATYSPVKVELELAKRENAGYRQYTCYLPGETAKTVVTGGGFHTFIAFRFETPEDAQKSADKMLERLVIQKGKRYGTGEYVPMLAIPYGERVFGFWQDKKKKDPGRQNFAFRPRNPPLPPGAYAFTDGLGLVNTFECAWQVEAFTVSDAPAPAPQVVVAPAPAPPAPPAAPSVDWRAVQAAAMRGDATAQLQLGQLYAAGRGVLQDFVEAHRWLNLAAARLSGPQQAEAAKLRDDLSARMTPAQLADAQRLAREWVEQSGRR